MCRGLISRSDVSMKCCWWKISGGERSSALIQVIAVRFFFQ